MFFQVAVTVERWPRIDLNNTIETSASRMPHFSDDGSCPPRHSKWRFTVALPYRTTHAHRMFASLAETVVGLDWIVVYVSPVQGSRFLGLSWTRSNAFDTSHSCQSPTSIARNPLPLAGMLFDKSSVDTSTHPNSSRDRHVE